MLLNGKGSIPKSLNGTRVHASLGNGAGAEPPNSSIRVLSRKRRAIRGALRALSRVVARRRLSRSLVLLYHAVGKSSYSVQPETFEAQMRFLQAHARVVPLEAIVSGRHHDSNVPLTCAITFDDGYAGVYEYAYPILRRYGFPAVLYVTTSALDREGLERPYQNPGFFADEPTMTWAQAREMSNAGIIIGSHLCHHLNMTGLRFEVGMEELGRSKEIISERMAADCKHFAYPYGLFNSQNVHWVGQSGYQSAVTVRHSVVPDRVDPLRIPRMCIDRVNSWADFEGMLNGGLDYLLVVREIRQMLGLPI